MSFSRVPGLDLYIGGIFDLVQAIETAKITHVVSLVKLDQYLRLFNIDPELFATKNIQHLSIPVLDIATQDLLPHFRATNEFIRDALDGGGNVLAHCGAGISRSATICIAYLLHTQPTKLTPDSALQLMQRTRSSCDPNSGFMEQLRLYHEMGCPLDPTEHGMYEEWKAKKS